MARNQAPEAPQHHDADDAALATGAGALARLHGDAAQVAELVGYELSYDRERVIQMFQFHASNAAEAMLNMGQHLILLKENEPHGEFVDIVENRLGLHVRAAQRMMQASLKYLATPALASKATTLSLLGKAKLFELMTLDNDDLVELSEGGSVAGISLDEIDRMSVRELKAALRDAQADGKAKDEVLANKSAAIDRLQTKQAKLSPPTHDEEVAQLRRETSDAAYHAEGLIRGTLREGMTRLIEDAAMTGAGHEEYCSGLLAQLERAITEVRSALGIKKAPDGDPTPEWDR